MKYCPECGSLLDGKFKCETCGWEGDSEKVQEPVANPNYIPPATGMLNPFESFEIAKGISNITLEELNYNVVRANLFNVHTSMKSSENVLKIMNQDNINLINLCRDMGLNKETKITHEEPVVVMENSEYKFVLDDKDFTILEFEKK